MARTSASLLLWIVAAIAIGQGHALRFTKDGQAVAVPDCPALHITGDMTIEAWVRPEIAARNYPFKFIVSKNYGGTGYDLLMVGVNNEDRFQFEASAVVNYGVPEPSVRNVWWHLAGVVSGNRQLLYVNGVKVADSPRQGEIVPNTLPLWIGASLWNNFRGSICEVRIWNVARTEDELAQNKDRYLKGDEPGLVAYFPFTEGTGRVLHNVTGLTPNGVIGYGFEGAPYSNGHFSVGHAANRDLPQWAQGVKLRGRPPRPGKGS